MNLRTVVCALAFAVLALQTPHIARADDSDDSKIEWNPKWRKVGVVEGLSLIPLVGASLAIQLAWTPPQHPRWAGGILFDGEIRSAFRGDTREAQLAAKTTGDMLYMVGSVAPILIDVGLTLTYHQRPDIALQILLIDLQSAAVAGLVSLTSEHAVGRGRPFVGDCQPDGSVRDQKGRLLPNNCNAGNEAKSFYSGHSAATMTAAGLTCLTHQRMPLFGGGFADVVPCALMLGVSFATGLTRIVADMHWASDVIVGWGIGALAGYVLPAAIHYGFSNDPDSRASVQIAPVAAASTQQVEVGIAGAF